MRQDDAGGVAGRDRGQFGPRLTALIAYCTVVCRSPPRQVEAMLADVLGIEISLGNAQKYR